MVEALYRKGLALFEVKFQTRECEFSQKKFGCLDLQIPDMEKEIDENFSELRKWVEPEDSKFVLLSAKIYRSRRLFGQALKIIAKNMDGDAPDVIKQKRKKNQLLF